MAARRLHNRVHGASMDITDVLLLAFLCTLHSSLKRY